MSVWYPRTCRACLVTNVKLYSIHDTGLAGLFGFIAGSPVEPTDGLPQFVCFYCHAQLVKFKEFRYQCRQTMAMFQDRTCMVIRNDPEDGTTSPTSISMIRMVPSTNISSLDQNKYIKPLYKTKNLIIEYIPKEIDENECVDVKTYTLRDNANSFHCVDNNIDNRHAYDDLGDCDDDDRKELDEKIRNNEKSNDFQENCVVNVEISVKSEIIEEADVTAEPFDEFKKETEALSDSGVIKDVVKIKRTKVKDKVSDNNKRDKKTKKKKCNRYNEKFEEDFVEFSKSHDVKVVCLSKEEQIRRVQERKDSKEYKDSRFSCDVCYKWFMSETAHKRHMRAHDPNSGSFVCDVCSMRYPTQHNLNTHARAHKKIFMCTLCDQANVCITRAKLHSRWHKGVKFECKVCHKEFNANTTYLNHVRESHKKVSCADCEESFLGTNELHKHRLTTHKDKQNECAKCAVVFQCAEALARHKSDDACGGESTLKLKPCLLCGESFSCRGSLGEHMRHKHSGDGDTFTCEQCQSVFTSDRALSAHFGTAHYSLKPRAGAARAQGFLCEWCAKSFPTALRLRQHHLLHSDERPFQCSLCHKLLKTKAGLEFHMNSHTGLRPYKCRVCAETFKSHAHRHNHLVMKHTTRERRHTCASCDKSFVTSSDLKKHVRYVHLRQPRPNQHKLTKNKGNG